MIYLFVILLSISAACAQQPKFVRIPGRNSWMGRTEVTVAQYDAFVRATGYRTAAERVGSQRTWRAPGFKVSRHQPVVYVTIDDASAYCKCIGARLPTDAEWEYAARAGATTRHFWGDQIDGRYLWYRANSRNSPQAVGRKRPNAWGLYDMEGNVWEWAISESQNGEVIGNRRGGSWVDCEDIETATGQSPAPLIGISKYFKIPAKTEHRYDDIGFRCVRETPR